jgi:alkanesulfonate monooxygenase SsuD/methylene tetrahydromethanopterin reductase-like flavin-dependent oxidoreductase (luciferase family)
VKFSTFHSFMLTDAKGVAPDHLLEGQRVGSTHHRAIADELQLIRAADRLGFDSCWMREHHFTDYGFLPNTMTMAAHAAALTERIRLGTAVITLPLHHPIRVAEEVALVDVLSGGRVDVGIGRGYQSVEFDAFGIPLREARDRTDEAIDVLRALWSKERVDHHGHFWHFDDVRLQPKPVQQPGPPLYYARPIRASCRATTTGASRRATSTGRRAGTAAISPITTTSPTGTTAGSRAGPSA